MKRIIFALLAIITISTCACAAAGSVLTLPIETAIYTTHTSAGILAFLCHPAVRAILVTLILAGLFMEVHTPGLGIAAAIALVAGVLYFLPMFLSGTLPAWIIIMLIFGIILIAFEMFVIPGFGVCGIIGITDMVIALTAAIMPSAAEGQGLFSLAMLGMPVAVIGTGLVAAIALVAWLTSRHGPKFVRRHAELRLTQDVKEGYIGVDMQPAELVGKKAKALTVLRPAGKVLLDDEVYDAVSTGEFIEAGSHVRIVRYENAQLYVEPTNLTI